MSSFDSELADVLPPEEGERRRHRRPPQPDEVVSVSRLTRRLVSVCLGGDRLDGFQGIAPTSHLKVYPPRPGQTEPLLPEVGPDDRSGLPTSPRRWYAPTPHVGSTRRPGR
jgi:NADPH-dependent ferric siderophore reductase